jgi:hypothetical protein
MVVEIEDTRVKDSTDTKPTAAILSVYLKEGRKIHLHQRHGSSDMPLEKIKIKRKTLQTKCLSLFYETPSNL